MYVYVRLNIIRTVKRRKENTHVCLLFLRRFFCPYSKTVLFHCHIIHHWLILSLTFYLSLYSNLSRIVSIKAASNARTCIRNRIYVSGCYFFLYSPNEGLITFDLLWRVYLCDVTVCACVRACVCTSVYVCVNATMVEWETCMWLGFRYGMWVQWVSLYRFLVGFFFSLGG